MRNWLPLYIAPLLGVSACSIESPQDPGPYKPVIQVTGTATDSETGLSLTGVTVRLIEWDFIGGDREMARSLTYAEGRFRLSGKAYDDCIITMAITAAKSGYRTVHTGIQKGPEIQCTGDIQTIDVRLQHL